MPILMPTFEQLKIIAKDLGVSFSEEDSENYLSLAKPIVDSYKYIELQGQRRSITKEDKRVWRFPSEAENSNGAWYVKTRIKNSEEGLLKGKTVVLKDNIMLATVPMMNGTSSLEGYIPTIDATVVTRVLEAGGTIVGKAACESFSLTTGSHTNDKGPVKNPFRAEYSAGGSSSGNAVLVATGEVDMAIGTDQGGSIRIPSSFCGIYGMKPTHDIVPYTGIVPVHPLIDHVGPMTSTVMDNALLLDALSGHKKKFYSKSINKGIAGLKIAVIKEGFINSEKEVENKIHNAAKILEALGASTQEVSVPQHRFSNATWAPIAIEGFIRTLHSGQYPIRPQLISEPAKLLALIGTYIQKNYGSKNLEYALKYSKILKESYHCLFKEFDLILLPTTPMKAPLMPDKAACLKELISHAFEGASNCLPFNLSHHPSMAIPCGLIEGLPISFQLVGNHFEENLIYRAAYSFEKAVNWKKI